MAPSSGPRNEAARVIDWTITDSPRAAARKERRPVRIFPSGRRGTKLDVDANPEPETAHRHSLPFLSQLVLLCTGPARSFETLNKLTSDPGPTAAFESNRRRNDVRLIKLGGGSHRIISPDIVDTSENVNQFATFSAT